MTFPDAAVATNNGEYVFVGGQPQLFIAHSEEDREFQAPTAKEFVSLCGERAAHFFSKDGYDLCRYHDSHGKRGRKAVKARHLPR